MTAQPYKSQLLKEQGLYSRSLYKFVLARLQAAEHNTNKAIELENIELDDDSKKEPVDLNLTPDESQVLEVLLSYVDPITTSDPIAILQQEILDESLSSKVTTVLRDVANKLSYIEGLDIKHSRRYSDKTAQNIVPQLRALMEKDVEEISKIYMREVV